MCEINGLEYYQKIRDDLIDLMPAPVNRVLEIGCGTGETLLAVREKGLAKEVWGIDQHEFKTQQKLDRFIPGDLDHFDFSRLGMDFDVVLAGDVLEHLKDPWQVLEQLRAVMNPESHLVICVPNVRDITVIWDLVFQGDFCYRSQGTMDRTHLRFFTRKSLVRLLQGTGFKVIRARGRIRGKRRYLNGLTFGLFRGFLERQCYAVATVMAVSGEKHGQ